MHGVGEAGAAEHCLPCLSGCVATTLALASLQPPLRIWAHLSPAPAPPPTPHLTGWGLDYVWPYLLRYPSDEIGIIDAVCVSHINWAALSRIFQPRYPSWSPYG